MEPINRPWYKKKRYLIPLGLIGITALTVGQNSPNIAVQDTQAVVPIVQQLNTQSFQQPIVTEQEKTPAQAPLSNNNYYVNVDGNTVHSPAYSRTAPQGASARCGDGTYSFSQHRQGTCSHHGGVASWL